MLELLSLACYALALASAQSLEYHFTMGVTSPAPIPGKPFTFTWTGGESNEVVYIVLNDYFPDTPNQNIIYGTTDILSNAPNNGSWTYNVPLNIEAGRHSFSIGYNPFQLSDQTEIFNISGSETSAVSGSAGPATTNTAFQSYNGCGLPPLPDYTYTGYQPPCTVTTSGRVETLYPIVPVSATSSFFTSIPSATTTRITYGGPPTSGPISLFTPLTLPPTSIGTEIATGVYAQALQCPVPVTPYDTSITSSGTTTVFSLASCSFTGQAATSSAGGTCRSSGYATFSVSGASSVCCPSQWSTTPLASQLYCFTSLGQQSGDVIAERQVSTNTLSASSSPVVQLTGVVFTTAGVVTHGAAVTGSSSSSSSTGGGGSGGGSSGSTGSAASAGAGASATGTKSDGVRLKLSLWEIQGIVIVMIILLCV